MHMPWRRSLWIWNAAGRPCGEETKETKKRHKRWRQSRRRRPGSWGEEVRKKTHQNELDGWKHDGYMGFSFWLNIYHSWYLPWRQKQALFLTWKRASEKATGTVVPKARRSMSFTSSTVERWSMVASMSSSTAGSRRKLLWGALDLRVTKLYF